MLPLVAIMAWVSLAYWPAWDGVFLLDDYSSILENSTVRTGDWWAALRTISRPLPTATFALDWARGDGQPFAFHQTNLLIHLSAVAALYWLVLITLQSQRFDSSPLRRQSIVIAMLVALLWGVHPLTTQAITYIVQRSEALMAGFFLLTLAGFAQSFRGHSRLWMALTMLTICAGLASKQVMVMVVPVMAIYQRTFWSTSWRDVFANRPGFWVLNATIAVLFTAIFLPSIIQGSGGAGFQLETVSSAEYVRTQPEVLLHYLKLVLLPYPLNLDYGWPPQSDPLQIAIATLVILLLALAVVWGLYRNSPTATWFAAAVLVLIPTSSILPLQDLAVEHRMYLPTAFLLVGLVMGLGPRVLLAQREIFRLVAFGGFAFLLLASTWLTYHRNQDYRSAVVMWRDVIETSQSSGRENRLLARAYIFLGQAYGDQGDWESSIATLQEALKLQLFADRAYANLARAQLELGDLPAAATSAQLALQGPSQSPKLWNLAGLIAAKAGNQPLAEDYFRKAAAGAPNDSEIQFNLASLLHRVQQNQEALEILDKICRREAGFEPAFQLFARIRFHLWQSSADATAKKRAYPAMNQSIQTYRTRFPKSLEGDYLEAMKQLQLGNVRQGTQLLQQICESRKHPPSGAHFQLAELYRSSGKPTMARTHYQKELSYFPNHVASLNNLGGIVAAEQPGLAIHYFQQVASLEPGFWQARFNIAALQVQLKNLDQASHTLDQLLKDNPGYEPAIALASRIQAFRQSENSSD